jgi:hypothetical protein
MKEFKGHDALSFALYIEELRSKINPEDSLLKNLEKVIKTLSEIRDFLIISDNTDLEVGKVASLGIWNGEIAEDGKSIPKIIEEIENSLKEAQEIQRKVKT